MKMVRAGMLYPQRICFLLIMVYVPGHVQVVMGGSSRASVERSIRSERVIFFNTTLAEGSRVCQNFGGRLETGNSERSRDRLRQGNVTTVLLGLLKKVSNWTRLDGKEFFGRAHEPWGSTGGKDCGYYRDGRIYADSCWRKKTAVCQAQGDGCRQCKHDVCQVITDVAHGNETAVRCLYIRRKDYTWFQARDACTFSRMRLVVPDEETREVMKNIEGDLWLGVYRAAWYDINQPDTEAVPNFAEWTGDLREHLVAEKHCIVMETDRAQARFKPVDCETRGMVACTVSDNKCGCPTTGHTPNDVSESDEVSMTSDLYGEVQAVKEKPKKGGLTKRQGWRIYGGAVVIGGTLLLLAALAYPIHKCVVRARRNRMNRGSNHVASGIVMANDYSTVISRPRVGLSSAVSCSTLGGETPSNHSAYEVPVNSIAGIVRVNSRRKPCSRRRSHDDDVSFSSLAHAPASIENVYEDMNSEEQPIVQYVQMLDFS